MGLPAPLPQRHTLRREAQAAHSRPARPDKGPRPSCPWSRSRSAWPAGPCRCPPMGSLVSAMFPSVAPAHLIGTVGVVLHRHLCPAAELRKHGGRHAVRGVAGECFTTTPPLSTGASLVSASSVSWDGGHGRCHRRASCLSASSARWSAAEEAQRLRDGRQRLPAGIRRPPLLGLGADLPRCQTRTAPAPCPLCAVRKPSVQANTGQVVQPGGRHELASAPQTVPGWLYSTRSPATTSSGAQSAVLPPPDRSCRCRFRAAYRPPDHGPGRT